MDYQQIIDEVYEEVKQGENLGTVATYIPELVKVDSDNFGVCLRTTDGKEYSAGNFLEPFSIQSIAKVLSLCLAFDLLDTKLWDRIGKEPSGTRFNSLIQLESESGIPRNPLINSGALVICDVLCSLLDSPKEDLLAFIRTVSDDPSIEYSNLIAESEKSQGYRNFAMVNFLRSFGNIRNDVDEVLDLYFHLCSITMHCRDLARSFLFLANEGRLPGSDHQILSPRKTERVNAIMQTCGFYDEAGEFAFRVGLPGKSGVGGGIVAIKPDEYSIAVWGPKLNDKGNSYRGMKFLELFTTRTEASIF